MAERIKVFLSYANEDNESVSRLYEYLYREGFQPWMDKHDILPGEKWELAIYRAIRRADFFLACLSQQSVGKRGFLQKEIKKGLSIWEEKLDEDIYLIPVLLENCDVPSPLNELEWVRSYEQRGLERLCQAIRVGAARIRKERERIAATTQGINLTTKHLNDVREGFPKYSINIEYPEFQGPAELGLDEVNLQIKAFAYNEAQLCRSIIFSNPIKLNGETIYPGCFMDGESQVALATNKIISVMFDFLAYVHPAAQRMRWRSSCNYSLSPVASFNLDHVFDPNSDYQAMIAEIIVSKIGSVLPEIHGLQIFEKQPERIGLFYPSESGSFNLTEDSIVFSFNGPLAVGVARVVIPYEEIRQYLNSCGPLMNLC